MWCETLTPCCKELTISFYFEEVPPKKRRRIKINPLFLLAFITRYSNLEVNKSRTLRDMRQFQGLFLMLLLGLLLRKNRLLRCWDYLSILNWIGTYIISIIRTTSKKSRALIRSIEVSLYLYKSTINGLILNTVVMYGLEFQSANWIYYISYRNGWVELLVLHLLPLLNP